MKRTLLFAATLCASQLAFAQNKTFDLYVVAEGNFGTPNGDVFKVSRTDSVTKIYSDGLYQTANTSIGIDVLQDFALFGNKAVFCGKGGSSNPVRLAITEFPSFDTIKTFTGGGVQCLGKASNTKAYVSMATGNSIQLLNLENNTLTAVTDANSYISSYATYMAAANGFMYVAMGSKIIKIDTATNTATASLLPGIGAIAGMEYDAQNNCIWLLGKVSGTSVLVKMEPSNNDLFNSAIVLTGITNAAYLRLAANKLYFLSGKNVHAYNIASPNIPTTALYTSTLPGSSFSFAYGKSFYADPLTGDFAMATAGNFAEPSRYEIVDGSTFQMIDSGHVSGRIANELVLNTYSRPVPDNSVLPDINAQCAVMLTPPSAMAGNVVITATTNDSLIYDEQGSYTVTWTYTNGYSSSTQTQQIIIDDTIAPVADITNLPALTVNCPYTLTPPSANDNCNGPILATTDSLTFTTGGNYVVNWKYTDAAGNVSTQMQQLAVSCATGLDELSGDLISLNIYPNPASDAFDVLLSNDARRYKLVVRNMIGKVVLNEPMNGNRMHVPVKGLPPGVYYVSLVDDGVTISAVKKLVIQ